MEGAVSPESATQAIAVDEAGQEHDDRVPPDADPPARSASPQVPDSPSALAEAGEDERHDARSADADQGEEDEPRR